ncbi:MAG: DUF2605 domain-containing protein [Symploca sp. SIO1B1]|nr:DUF2605 domain-containing protein [Symploca sp. SIO2D2]NER22480.1 DUF2605 domain-containing protein [Symploca sp. SIO1C2]NER46874.1 DUF2605 domain-containing protein [Symploca sp. SIO1A3]NER96733.1 DUF2605 domain-containing protein [Symploca sp. SIO1B1]
MSQPQPTEKELLQNLLPPLLDDFQYWFSRSRSLLESEEITFLSQQEQTDLLARVKQAQQEVSTAQMLFQATGRQVGLEVATLMPWHQLVGDCWQVAMQWRSLKSKPTKLPNSREEQI